MLFKKLFFLTILLSSLLFMNTPFSENLYKWVDESGQTHYSQKPPSKNNTVKVNKLQLKSYKAGKKESQKFYSEHCENGNTQLCDKARKAWKIKEHRKLVLERERENRPGAIQAYIGHQEDIQWKENRNRIREQNVRSDRAAAEQKRSADEQLVSDCKRNRDVYCDKGASYIRDELHIYEPERIIMPGKSNAASRWNNVRK